MKALALVLMVFSTVFARTVHAEIHDYMILRLIYLHTSCGTLTLERLTAPAPHARFQATCRNVSTYPDGLVVLCTDPDDDRACRVETQAKSFDSLELLQPPRENP